MRHRPDTVMLFCAGFGTRMAPLTDSLPKPLIAVAGRPLIDHARDLCTAAGFTRQVANLHYLGAKLADHLDGTGVLLSWEDDRILDTGGGLRAVLPLVGPDPLATLNPDAVWTGPNPLAALAEAWDPARMDALLMTIPAARAEGRTGGGDFTLSKDGHLSRGGDHVYCGAQILKTERLAEIPDQVFSLNRLWDLVAAERRLFGLTHAGGWCDVGHPAGIALAEAMLSRDG
ncbi:nucleotidyltransferase family protein [Oceaniglobus roseus]|uniref:nucleotidyltransferase family protein n=1 Tax=Oceaniglobus roseus TaxID=1737570 RepID=UPI000C7EFF6A|nr:nucleotidyltransferase family protein [Kandeliimicrobium roseum]